MKKAYYKTVREGGPSRTVFLGIVQHRPTRTGAACAGAKCAACTAPWASAAFASAGQTHWHSWERGPRRNSL